MDNCKFFMATDEKTSLRRVGFGIGIAFGLLCVLDFGAQFAGATLWRSLAGPGASAPLWLNWVLSFLPLYGVAFPVYLTMLQRLPRVRLARQRLPLHRFIWAACAALALMYAGALLGNGLSALIGLLKGQPLDSGVQQLLQDADPWQTLVFVCILAPIGEELIFGNLLRYALPFGEKRAILLCALAFGAFHGNLYQFFYAFLVRLVLAWLYLCSGSLGWCIALHSLLNLLGGFVSQQALGWGEQALAAYALALLCMLGAGIGRLAGRWKKTRLRPGRPAARGWWLFASPGMLMGWAALAAILALSVL